MNKTELLPSRSSPSSRGQNDRQWPMPASGKCRNTGENAVNMQLSISSFSYIFISQIGGIWSVLHSGLAWIPSRLVVLLLVPRVGNLFCGCLCLDSLLCHLANFLLTLLGEVPSQCPPKGSPWSPAGSVPFCLASFLPITWLLYPLLLLQRGSHLLCLPSAWQGLNYYQLNE